MLPAADGIRRDAYDLVVGMKIAKDLDFRVHDLSGLDGDPLRFSVTDTDDEAVLLIAGDC